MATDLLTHQTVDHLMADDNFSDIDGNQFANESAQNSVRQLLTGSRGDTTTLSPRRELKRKIPGDALDRELDNNGHTYDDTKIDQEIKVKKQRVPIPKLDADRLLSSKGIPKIRTLTSGGSAVFKKKLRLKGRGHEFADCARLLNFYQMWLDDLYPRAKFADALQLVEKAGHSKLMQVHRKSWMEEGKLSQTRGEFYEGRHASSDQGSGTAQFSGREPETEIQTRENKDILSYDELDENEPDRDELDALLAQTEDALPVETRPRSKTQTQSEFVDRSDDEELEAFLAEETARQRRLNREKEHQQGDNFTGTGSAETGQLDQHRSLIGPGKNADTTDNSNRKLDASRTGEQKSSEAAATTQTEEIYDGLPKDYVKNPWEYRIQNEIELPPSIAKSSSKSSQDHDALGSEEVPALDTDNLVSSSPIPNIHTDDLDQLMEEHERRVKTQGQKVSGELVQEFLSSSPLAN